MKSNSLTILDRLNEILESIKLIDEWSRFATNASDFMMSPHVVMAFNAFVMRLQVIGGFSLSYWGKSDNGVG